MATQHDIDEDVAVVMAQAEALIQEAKYELECAAKFFKKNNFDLSTIGSNLSEADHAEVQRRIEDGRRQVEAGVVAARLTIGTHKVGDQQQARKSRLMRNLV